MDYRHNVSEIVLFVGSSVMKFQPFYYMNLATVWPIGLKPRKSEKGP